MRKLLILTICLFVFSWGYSTEVLPGIHNTDKYLELLKDKKVAVVANQTSLINKQHLVDFLIEKKVNIQKIFCPEHGFRGVKDAGEFVKDGKDKKTNLPLVSLYGKNKKPTKDQLKDIEIVVFDIQDVGARFYTYISTLHYVMEACAENNIKVIVLDRPNPNIFYVDGPVLKKEHKSFVGMHPVPVVYGMSIGEYAQMINGENWLKNNIKCNLTVIPCLNYGRNDLYKVPVKPSPNLPNMNSIYLYPSLCFFEGTIISVGRGTEIPFQTFGHPKLKEANSTFTPKSIPGVCKCPKYQDKKCKAISLKKWGAQSILRKKKLNLYWLMMAYKNTGFPENFFNEYIYNLIGDSKIVDMLKKKKSVKEIELQWDEEVQNFKKIRAKYLIYK